MTIPAGGRSSCTSPSRSRPRCRPRHDRRSSTTVIVVKAAGLSVTGQPAHDADRAGLRASRSSRPSRAAAPRWARRRRYTVDVTNEGYTADSYTLATSGTWPTTTYDATCTTPLTTTPTVAGGATHDGMRQGRRAGECGQRRHSDTEHLTATSVGQPERLGDGARSRRSPSRRTPCWSTTTPTTPTTRRRTTRRRWAASGYGYWDLAADPNLPLSYLTAHKNVVWWTGNSYPAPDHAVRVASSPRSSTAAAGC